MDISEETREMLDQLNTLLAQIDPAQEPRFRIFTMITVQYPDGRQVPFEYEPPAQQLLQDELDLVSFREACRRNGSDPAARRDLALSRLIHDTQTEILRAAGVQGL